MIVRAPHSFGRLYNRGCGLGSTLPTQTGGSTWSICAALPYFVAAAIPACRESAANTAADIYDWAYYGGSAPAPGGVLAGNQQEQIRLANLEIIRAAEANGYHPQYSNYAGLTAQEIADEAAKLKSSVLDWKVIAAVGAVAVITLGVVFGGRK